jgi:hypothetical protein
MEQTLPTIHFHRIVIPCDGHDKIQFAFKFLWTLSPPTKLYCLELKTRNLNILAMFKDFYSSEGLNDVSTVAI